jgi:hypothetical protein
METWVLSVEQWRNIIIILEGLNINTEKSFSRLKGLNKTRVYNNAILLSRHKIPERHRKIVPNTIRRISIQCKGRTNRDVLAIILPRNLCNLIKSQHLTPLN